MMRRFAIAAGAYLAVCLVAIAIILLRGDGPYPTVVAIYPFNGDRYWPGGTAEISFSHPMDEASVERGLEVTPGSQGQGAWYGNTLNLQPVGDWRPDVTYHVRLVGKVTDDQGRPLSTPFSFWFHVHHVAHLVTCLYRGVPNVCEHIGSGAHMLTFSPMPVLQYSLSSDGTLLAYTRRDRSELPHLFVVGVDGTGARQLTGGQSFADSNPRWPEGVTSSITYDRRPVISRGSTHRLGKVQLWNVNTDGTNNAHI